MPYNPKVNGLTKWANGIVGKILNKVVKAHKRDWDTKLTSTIHFYNTIEKTMTSYMSFFLVLNTTEF